MLRTYNAFSVVEKGPFSTIMTKLIITELNITLGNFADFLDLLNFLKNKLFQKQKNCFQTRPNKSEWTQILST